jgi:hypothetical protein
VIALMALVAFGAAGAAFFLLQRPVAAPPVTTAAAPSVGALAAVAADDELPEPCESYLREIERCVAAHPEMSALRDNAPQQRAAFKLGLSTPESRAAIISACDQSLKALQEACK